MRMDEIIYGVFFQPARTFAYLGIDRKKLGWGIGIFLVIMLSNGLMTQAINMHSQSAFAWPKSWLGWLGGLKLTFSWFFIMVMAGFISLLAEWFCKRGNGLGLLIAFCFSLLPFVFGTPVHYALVLIGFPNLGAFFSLMAFIWVMVLQIIAIKAVLELETGPALSLYFSPVIFLLVVSVIVLSLGLFFSALFS